MSVLNTDRYLVTAQHKLPMALEDGHVELGQRRSGVDDVGIVEPLALWRGPPLPVEDPRIARINRRLKRLEERDKRDLVDA